AWLSSVNSLNSASILLQGPHDRVGNGRADFRVRSNGGDGHADVQRAVVARIAIRNGARKFPAHTVRNAMRRFGAAPPYAHVHLLNLYGSSVFLRHSGSTFLFRASPALDLPCLTRAPRREAGAPC